LFAVCRTVHGQSSGSQRPSEHRAYAPGKAPHRRRAGLRRSRLGLRHALGPSPTTQLPLPLGLAASARRGEPGHEAAAAPAQSQSWARVRRDEPGARRCRRAQPGAAVLLLGKPQAGAHKRAPRPLAKSDRKIRRNAKRKGRGTAQAEPYRNRSVALLSTGQAPLRRASQAFFPSCQHGIDTTTMTSRWRKQNATSQGMTSWYLKSPPTQRKRTASPEGADAPEPLSRPLQKGGLRPATPWAAHGKRSSPSGAASQQPHTAPSPARPTRSDRAPRKQTSASRQSAAPKRGLAAGRPRARCHKLLRCSQTEPAERRSCCETAAERQAGTLGASIQSPTLSFQEGNCHPERIEPVLATPSTKEAAVSSPCSRGRHGGAVGRERGSVCGAAGVRLRHWDRRGTGAPGDACSRLAQQRGPRHAPGASRTAPGVCREQLDRAWGDGRWPRLWRRGALMLARSWAQDQTQPSHNGFCETIPHGTDPRRRALQPYPSSSATVKRLGHFRISCYKFVAIRRLLLSGTLQHALSWLPAAAASTHAATIARWKTAARLSVLRSGRGEAAGAQAPPRLPGYPCAGTCAARLQPASRCPGTQPATPAALRSPWGAWDPR